jgi:NAD(P)-dependent dehydrogenase (short-subunit alcohol dehydrogenase family)
MQPALEDQVAVVTGASSGIGRATAIRLAQCGASVVLAARRERELTEVADTIRESAGRRDRASVFSLDVRDEASVEALAEHAVATFGKVDIAVLSAGVGRGAGSDGPVGRPVHQLATTEWDELLDTNLRGAFLVIRSLVPHMIARRSGHIFNVSSARGGVRGQAFGAPYSASKFALAGMTESLADEVRTYGVRVHLIFPDVTDTPLLQKTTLSGRLGPLLAPERVANLIVSMIAFPADAVLQEPVVAPFPVRPAGN